MDMKCSVWILKILFQGSVSQIFNLGFFFLYKKSGNFLPFVECQILHFIK